MFTLKAITVDNETVWEFTSWVYDLNRFKHYAYEAMRFLGANTVVVLDEILHEIGEFVMNEEEDMPTWLENPQYIDCA